MDGDSGAEAGMGHVFRAAEYARLLIERVKNLDIRFFMRDFPEGRKKIGDHGFAIHPLPVRPEKYHYQEALQAFGADVLIVDTLGCTPELMEVGRTYGCSIVTLDDLGPVAGEADVIYNGIVWATRWLPERSGEAKIYQGVQYMPLRSQFASASQGVRNFSRGIENILITTGGADGRGASLQLMEATRRLPFDCLVNVMIGPAYNSSADLKKAAERMRGRIQFSILENKTNMADYLVEADLALLTGGTVMFESAACGTPSVIVCTYEHQVPQAEWFAGRGIGRSMGYFQHAIGKAKIARAIEELAVDPSRRQAMSTEGKRAVDGRGMFRLVETLAGMLEK